MPCSTIRTTATGKRTGSTVIILLKENQVVIDNDIIENSMNDKETVVKLGETIGKKY